MTAPDYQVGIVGCGVMGRAHARAYEALDETHVVAVAEPQAETRDDFTNDTGVEQSFENHRDMLAAVDLDIVSICTWPGTHASITIDAAEAGVNGIYCEKPMATSLGQTDAMIEAAERNGVVLTVGHQRRYDPVHVTARDVIADGAIGEPTFVRVANQDGLLNWGTHLIDLGRFLIDDPATEWIMGQFERTTDRHERGQPIEDRCMGIVCFETGIRMTIEIDLPKTAGEEPILQVYGSEGWLELELGTRVRITGSDGPVEYAPEDDRSPWVAFLADMLRAMEDDGYEHRCNPALARPTIEIAMGIYESSRRNRLVETPLRTTANPLERMIENDELTLAHPGKYDIRRPESITEE